MHRIFAARELGKEISALVVDNVPDEYPYYALAVEDGGDGVEAWAELPDDFVRKAYRIPSNYKALFRDFNEVFPGAQGQRRRTNPGHLKAQRPPGRCT